MNPISFYQVGNIPAIALAASAIISLLALTGFYIVPLSVLDSEADMFITPEAKTLTVGETFTITVDVSATVPVNVFTGLVWFNNETLEVVQIDYNTSVADLWTEEPWYKNGDGSIGFAGGTTKPGGFTGSDTLITITFLATHAGDGNITIEDARILEHNGAGTDAVIAVLEPTYFTITSTSSTTKTIVQKTIPPADIVVLTEERTTDLNGDGKVTIGDVSSFMVLLSTGNRIADFNGDGSVNTSDLSILLDAL